MDRATFARPPSTIQATPFPGRLHRDLEAWVRRRTGATDHERRVAQIAEAWFDLTRDLHDLNRRAHWALIAAAIVHDVGRSVDPADHAALGAQMILTDTALSLSPIARRWLAYLTLHHRGPVPEIGHDEILKPGDDRLSLWKVLGLLRAADTLDSRSIDPPRVVLMRRNRAVQVWCFLPEPSVKVRKAFCRAKKYRLLERTLNCSVDVQIHHADARLVHV